MIRSASLLAIALAGCSGGPVALADESTGDQPGSFRCTVASITDGDTLRCRETETDGRQIRVRLSGIAARERDGSCSPGHPCPDATAEAATAALRELVTGDTLACAEEGRTYGRRAAFCRTSAGLDVSCAMLASGTVLRWDRYWRDRAC